MCGIAGIMSREGHHFDQGLLDRLTAALAHRGPDGSGRYFEDGVGLVSTRLAIIDLKTGDQPFLSHDGVALVANGEIYNDLDIRSELTACRFMSASDCESPLQLYRQEGQEAAERLRGMYAIAIHDQARSKLVLMRDPFGIKPLYFAISQDSFAFASEPQALIRAGLATRRIDAEKRSELLQLKFTTGRRTIFSDIRRVLPGETVVVSGGEIVDRQRQPALPRGTSRSNGLDPVKKVGEVLAESVHAHIRSDVPYGLFLSGGIDSAVLIALMSRQTTQPVAAFTAAFPDSRAKDESEAAARVAKAVGADHHVVNLTKEDFWTVSPRVAAALDDPTTDAAALPTFKLAALAKACNVKVVLSGEGGDEMFGGYSRYRRATWLWGLLSRQSRTHGVFDRLLDGEAKACFGDWRYGLAECEKDQVLAHRSPLQRLQAIDCAEWLPNDLLTKLDRCLMANSVEGRTPFLDPIVGPYAFDLPDDLKVRGRFGKWLLREWLSENLPAADAFARKAGFNPPIGEWIESYKDDLTKLVQAAPGIAEMSMGGAVAKTLGAPAENGQAAWSLVFYALWHSHHVLGVPADGSIGDVLSDAARRG